MSGRDDRRARTDGGATAGGAATGERGRIASGLDAYRAGALVGALALIGSFAGVLYHVTDVVGGVGAFAAVSVGAFALATVFAGVLRPRTALAVTAVLLGGGLAVYLLSLPESQLEVLSAASLLSDTVALLTGLSVLRLTAAGTWAMAVAPGPVFLAWYLAVRRRYAAAALVGGAALFLFVLTGDAGTIATLVGVVGAATAVGLGTLDLRGGSLAQVDALAIVLAAMIVLSATVSVVPGGEARPLTPDTESATVQGGLVTAGDQIEVLGSVRLSPKVRFTVESDEGTYWQTAAYDRYTGTGWVRTGNAESYDGRLSGPPGDDRRVEQTFTAKTGMTVLPAAWRPVSLQGDVTATAMVTPQGNLRPGRTLSSGEEYTVVSRTPEYTAAELRAAGTDYPDSIEQRYAQLPSSTPDRVRERASQIAGDEQTPYDKALAIEQWLESNKRYSLDVQRPDGNVADKFLFEMEAGYCVYYATAMTVLLRAEGVPARFVTGYTTGEQVGEDEYVVRGLDSHAWVEAYFPEVGWVRFDPTPSNPRESAEQAQIQQARQNGTQGVDTEETEPTTTTPTPTPESVSTDAANDTERTTIAPGTAGAPPNRGGTATTPPAENLPPGVQPGSNAGSGSDSGGGPSLPSRRTLGIGLVALVGVAAGLHRSGAAGRAYRSLLMLHQRPGDDPDRDVERAFERTEFVLGRRYGPPDAGETPRAYVDRVTRFRSDERVREVADLYERARYGDGVTREEADRAIELANDLARESTPIVRRFTE